MATVLTTSNLSGFAKFEWSDRNYILYYGNNLTIIVRESRYITLQSDSQAALLTALWACGIKSYPIDFDDLDVASKLGTLTAEELVEKWIADGTLTVQGGQADSEQTAIDLNNIILNTRILNCVLDEMKKVTDLLTQILD